jgi:hypothetical protein
MGPKSRQSSTPPLNELIGSLYSDPEFSWLLTIAPTSIAFLAGMGDPSYADKVIVADNNIGQLSMFTLNSARDGFVLSGNLADLVADGDTERASLAWGRNFRIPTQIEIGPDQALYVMSLSQGTPNSGMIYRIATPEPCLSLLLMPMLLLLLRRRPAISCPVLSRH